MPFTVVSFLNGNIHHILDHAWCLSVPWSPLTRTGVRLDQGPQGPLHFIAITSSWVTTKCLTRDPSGSRVFSLCVLAPGLGLCLPHQVTFLNTQGWDGLELGRSRAETKHKSIEASGSCTRVRPEKASDARHPVLGPWEAVMLQLGPDGTTPHSGCLTQSFS